MAGTMGALAAAGAKATVQGSFWGKKKKTLHSLHARIEASVGPLEGRKEYADLLPDFLVNMSASADVLAQAKVEIDLSTIPEGKNVPDPNFPMGYDVGSDISI